MQTLHPQRVLAAVPQSLAASQKKPRLGRKSAASPVLSSLCQWLKQSFQQDWSQNPFRVWSQALATWDTQGLAFTIASPLSVLIK